MRGPGHHGRVVAELPLCLGGTGKTAGYPERFALENLGHNSKAIHRAYSRKAQVKLPSLVSMSGSGSCFPMAMPGNLWRKSSSHEVAL